MMRHCHFDDATHECLFVAKDGAMAVNTVPAPTGNKIQINAAFILRTADDVARAEKALGVCREMLAIWDSEPSSSSPVRGGSS